MCIGPDLADISRLFCEVIRSEFNAANPASDFVIHQKPCNQSTLTGNTTLQQHFLQQQQQPDKQTPGKKGGFWR